MALRMERRLAVLLISLMPAIAAAHHGSGISYDTGRLWSTWATMDTFNFKNPHPTMTFTRTTKDGKVEAWVSELLTAPALLLRAGWSRARSEEALKAGTRVKLYVGTARVGGLSGIVMRVENEKGQEILGDRAQAPMAVDMDGVPMGLQPSEEVKRAAPRQSPGAQ